MATPKRKTTKSKSRMRAASWKAQVPTYAECAQCHQPKLPHRVCGNCGYYAGREVIEVE
jgi:large subunit ribosomal protein L32